MLRRTFIFAVPMAVALAVVLTLHQAPVGASDPKGQGVDKTVTADKDPVDEQEDAAESPFLADGEFHLTIDRVVQASPLEDGRVVATLERDEGTGECMSDVGYGIAIHPPVGADVPPVKLVLDHGSCDLTFALDQEGK